MVATTKQDENANESTAIVRVGEARMAKPMLLRPIAQPAEVVAAIQETQALLREILVEGVDYGVIPGTGGGKDSKEKQRKVLLKPGAEKISIGFGCHPEYELLEREVDHEKVMRFPISWQEAPDPGWDEKERMKKATPPQGRNRKVNGEWQWQVPGVGVEETVGIYRFRYKCRIVRFDGQIVGEGEGVCSSLESKYRSRPHDVENTILKMSQKRARIAATLDAFGLSEAFTQDVGDDEGAIPGEVVGEAKKPSPARQAVAATEEAMREAGAKPGFQTRTDDEEARRGAAALAWSLAFLDKLDKATDLKKDADDDAKRGAAEAFTMLCDENVTAMGALVTQAPKLHFAVDTYVNVLGAHVHGLVHTPDARQRAALDWLHKQRGPHEPAPAPSTSSAGAAS